MTEGYRVLHQMKDYALNYIWGDKHTDPCFWSGLKVIGEIVVGAYNKDGCAIGEISLYWTNWENKLKILKVDNDFIVEDYPNFGALIEQCSDMRFVVTEDIEKILKTLGFVDLTGDRWRFIVHNNEDARQLGLGFWEKIN